MPQLEEKFNKHSHSVAVSQISVDHPGEHVASCSTDGRVIITGLYTNENNHSLNAGKPIYSVALDPIFARPGKSDQGRTVWYYLLHLSFSKYLRKQAKNATFFLK